ncbi:MAG: Ig-like domain-containing protein [Thermogemmata sp.]|nr:Ig-like domain-containing protein [Thermogemmata sp.]
MRHLRFVLLRLESLESREVPAVVVESFNAVTPPLLPPGWESGTNPNTTMANFATTAGIGMRGSVALINWANSSRSSGWAAPQPLLPADTAVAASFFINSLVPVYLFTRGVNLNTPTPSYLAVVITRGLSLEVQEVVDGQTKVLGRLDSPPTAYLSNRWVQVWLRPQGNQVVVQVIRLDSGEYLNSSGTWSNAETTAMTVTTSWLPVAGRVGTGRLPRYTGEVILDDFVYQTPEPVGISESFDSRNEGSFPENWFSTNSGAPGNWSISHTRAVSLPGSLASLGGSTTGGLAGPELNLPADVAVAATIYADSLIPARVVVRGTDLEGATPSYYAAQLRRGVEVALIRVVNGVETTLGSVRSQQWLSNQWVRLQLTAVGDRLRLAVIRDDTQQWLSADGSWSDTPDFALEVRDGTLMQGGRVALARSPSYAGTIFFDDFRAHAIDNNTGPTVTVAPLGGNSPFSGDVTFQAIATGSIVRLEFRLDGLLRAVATTSPARWTLDTTTLTNGTHLLQVRAYDSEGNLGVAEYTFTTRNTGQDPLFVPDIPRHFSHIRIAQLAYSGNPMGSFERQLLQTAVDLVVPNVRYLSLIDSIAPQTPQLIYGNVSNLYQDLLTDWLSYADRIGVSRELAFYHVTRATPFQGSSPSSQPVTWFWWAVQTIPNGTSTAVTTAVRGGGNGVPLGAVGTTTAIGYPEPFREVNIRLLKAAATGWNGVWEYVAAIDNQGNPILWKPLPLLQDDTNGQRQSGRLTFDPPRDWVPASLSGSARLYYVRFRVTGGTNEQQAIWQSALGRDYVQANGGTSGVIPAFDATADRDGDGYLNDAEYARRRPGYDARFVYESRLFYPYYGQMRFVTNPADVNVRRWAADYYRRLLLSYPQADGLFLDNATGRIPFAGISVQEATAAFSIDSAALVATVSRAIAPKWIMLNTAGGGNDAIPLTSAAAASFEEFLLRPMQANWAQVLDVVDLVASRLAPGRSAYLVLDTHPGSFRPTDPRTQLAALAYYYLLADPQRTFLMFFGGHNPSSSWTEHWSPAAAIDVGQPVGSLRVFATGTDPTDPRLVYRVYARDYTKALVLYKPLSYALGVGTGTTADNTATTHALGGTYRRLQADGTLGPLISSITLRNGEGAILLRS